MVTSKQKLNKGFAEFAVILVIGAVFAGIVTYEKFKRDTLLGATVYTTQLTDTINTFRNQVNSSTANLNAELSSVSSTLLTRGTIFTENTPLAANKGGTGLSSAPSDAQFLSAVGTAPTWKTLASSTGITLTTTATTTIIGTAGFDNTANIAFTGNNSFAGTSTFNANLISNSTTTLSNLVINGILLGFDHFQLFTASTTWTVPTGTTQIFISGVGAGGGGGGGKSGTAEGGSGAGSGSWISRFPTSTTPGTAIVITIGSIGLGGAGGASPATGTSATPTIVGNFLTLNGGNGGGVGGGGNVPGPATSTILSGTTITGNSTAGTAGGGNPGGAGASITSGAWICLGGAGGSAGGSAGSASTIGYGCGGGGGGGAAGAGGDGGNGGPTIVYFEW